MIFSFEIIKFGTSQSSCFIEDDPLKGQNKGQRVYENPVTIEITGFYVSGGFNSDIFVFAI